MTIQKFLRKYFIMGSQNCDRDPVEILESAAKSGITAFQFREKGAGSLSGDDKLELGKQLREVCSHYEIPFFINDDVELVQPLDVDGIHVGQDDISVKTLRERFPNKFIGLSVSNIDEVENSPISFVDYIGAGPMYATSTKDDAKAVIGPEWISNLREKYPKLPVIGIGGITTENAATVMKAGADGVAVVSAIAKAKNIARVVESL